MTTLHRAQLLLEAEQHEALSSIAKEEGRSISNLVREIVRRHLVERERSERNVRAVQAIERLSQIRAGLQKDRGAFTGDPLAEVRAEWEHDVERVWQGDP